MDQDTTEIIETLNLILAQMATKDDVEALRVEVREGFANIQVELRDIRLRLDPHRHHRARSGSAGSHATDIIGRDDLIGDKHKPIIQINGRKMSIFYTLYKYSSA